VRVRVTKVDVEEARVDLQLLDTDSSDAAECKQPRGGHKARGKAARNSKGAGRSKQKNKR